MKDILIYHWIGDWGSCINQKFDDGCYWDSLWVESRWILTLCPVRE